MGTNDSRSINERLGELFETIRALAEAEPDYARLLATVAERTAKLLGDCCMIFACGAGDSLEVAAFFDRDPDAAKVIQEAIGAEKLDTRGRTLVARVIRTGVPAMLATIDPETSHADIRPEDAARVRQLGVRSILCVPLLVRGKITGALSVIRHRRESSPFDEDDLTFVRGLADYVALALANAQLFDSVRIELRERRVAEEEAKKFVALVQHSREFIAMASFEGEILFVNDAGRKLLGIDPEHHLSTLSLRDFHTEDGMKRAAILRAQGHWEGEGQLRHFKTGALIPTEITSLVLRAIDGEPLCFATIQRDVRETKKLEEHLRQVQKMEAVGRLAGGIAHDFNNLLSVIISYGKMALGVIETSSPVAADLREILTAGERAATLTRKLLAFSRQQVLEPRVVNLTEVLAGMDNMLRRIIGEDVELRTTADPKLGNVKVDPGQIEQVMLNLAVNARDAMPDGGTLSIRLENASVDEESAPTSGLFGPCVVLSVTDTGTGMDEATKSRVFEPFFTTKPVGKGTGLGLATVFGVVKQSGGHIAVTTELGKGTTFTIHLPRWDGAVERPTSVRSAPSVALHGDETVLLVEDDAQVRALMLGILQRAGYRTLEAPGPEDALARSRSSDEEIHLLVTDIVMPKMSGRELVDALTRERPAMKTLYVSGYSEDAIAHRGALDPGVALLRKPVTPADLLQRVRDVLDG